MLPCSFRLSYGELHFELAAACQREKDAWLSSVHESLTHVPTWVNEPIPSFRFDEKGELLPESDDGVSDPPVGLATIRSIPELNHISDAELSEPFFASLRGHGKSRKRRSGHETPTKGESSLPPSRRSSSTSVKAIFSPMASDNETVLIRRSSPAARLQVDQELQDVISQSVLTARSYAFSHEVELFQAPKTIRSGFSRSNSGISMAGMSRLSKHESVRVPRRRTTESLDSLLSRGTSPLHKSTSGTSTKRNVKKLSLASIEYEVTSHDPAPENLASPCPSPASSQSPSASSSLLTTETIVPVSDSPPAVADSEQLPVAKNRSFVRNVKGIFHLRPSSPVFSGHSTVPLSAPLSGQNISHYNVLQRWTVRRRARSVNDRPSSSAAIFEDSEKSYPIVPSRTEAPLST